MQAMVLDFPAPEDRAVVETAVNVFLWTQKPVTRVQMLSAARGVLNKYNISKLHVGECTVEREEGQRVVISAKKTVPAEQRTCPGCGAELYDFPGDVQIMSIREGRNRDLVTYGCRCGCIFEKREDLFGKGC